jgi:hypothetical protein
VALLVAEPGEAIVPGQPVLTLQPGGKRWATFDRSEVGDHDLNTSLIRADPVSSAGNLQPGMSVLLDRTQAESAVR